MKLVIVVFFCWKLLLSQMRVSSWHCDFSETFIISADGSARWSRGSRSSWPNNPPTPRRRTKLYNAKNTGSSLGFRPRRSRPPVRWNVSLPSPFLDRCLVRTLMKAITCATCRVGGRVSVGGQGRWWRETNWRRFVQSAGTGLNGQASIRPASPRLTPAEPEPASMTQTLRGASTPRVKDLTAQFHQALPSLNRHFISLGQRTRI